MGLANNAPSCDFDAVADFCEGPMLKVGVGVWDACIPNEAETAGLDASMAILYLEGGGWWKNGIRIQRI